MELDSLVIEYDDIIDDDTLRSMTHLRELVLGQNRQITDRGLSSLTRLERLALPHNQRITSSVLTQLPALTSLNLEHNTWLHMPSLRPLAPQLRELRIGSRLLVNEEGKSSIACYELVSPDWRHVNILVHGGSGWWPLEKCYTRS